MVIETAGGPLLCWPAAWGGARWPGLFSLLALSEPIPFLFTHRIVENGSLRIIRGLGNYRVHWADKWQPASNFSSGTPLLDGQFGPGPLSAAHPSLTPIWFCSPFLVPGVTFSGSDSSVLFDSFNGQYPISFVSPKTSAVSLPRLLPNFCYGCLFFINTPPPSAPFP